jgi:hypothetical protein
MTSATLEKTLDYIYAFLNNDRRGERILALKIVPTARGAK